MPDHVAVHHLNSSYITIKAERVHCQIPHVSKKIRGFYKCSDKDTTRLSEMCVINSKQFMAEDLHIVKQL